jgi:hypothetical protein
MNINALQNIETFTNQQGQQKVVLDAEVWNKVLNYLASLQNTQSQTSVKSALDVCQQTGIRSKEDIDNSLNNEREAWGE